MTVRPASPALLLAAMLTAGVVEWRGGDLVVHFDVEGFELLWPPEDLDIDTGENRSRSASRDNAEVT